jgi:hypothetical protein
VYVVGAKNANIFAKFFGENILIKNLNIGPPDDTSSVSLAAPKSPSPSAIIVILLVRDRGAATSAAIFGITCSIMSTWNATDPRFLSV